MGTSPGIPGIQGDRRRSGSSGGRKSRATPQAICWGGRIGKRAPAGRGAGRKEESGARFGVTVGVCEMDDLTEQL
jgi:hypothetical protein